MLYMVVEQKPCVFTIKHAKMRQFNLLTSKACTRTFANISSSQWVIQSFTWVTRVRIRKPACKWKVWLNVRQCRRGGCIILSSPIEATINCIVYVSHAFSNISGECRHLRDEERALTVTCVLDEVRIAVEKLYKILDIYEMYEYQVTQ